jgi:hypothetical protein
MLNRIFLLALAVSFTFGCPSQPQSNRTVEIGGGSATPVATPKQNTANAAIPTSTARPDEAAGVEQTFEVTAGITEKKNPNVKESVVMAYVRSARHEGYDRVVFEFLGDQLPSYKIEYIDRPVRACGSGDVVPFAGDAWLSVRFTGAQAHAPEGDATIPMKDRTQSPNLPVVKDLKLICDFEGEVEWVMGNASPNRYRVLELSNPTRLVVDIKN